MHESLKHLIGKEARQRVINLTNNQFRPEPDYKRPTTFGENIIKLQGGVVHKNSNKTLHKMLDCQRVWIRQQPPPSLICCQPSSPSLDWNHVIIKILTLNSQQPAVAESQELRAGGVGGDGEPLPLGRGRESPRAAGAAALLAYRH